MQGNHIGTISKLTKNWQLSMWIKLLSASPYWRSIFHATNTGTFGKTRNGERIPALFQVVNTPKVRIHYLPGFPAVDIDTPWNVFVHLRVTQKMNFEDNKYHFSVYVNRTMTKTIVIKNPEELSNTFVYISNPMWTPSNSILKDVTFGNLYDYH